MFFLMNYSSASLPYLKYMALQFSGCSEPHCHSDCQKFPTWI